MQPNTSKPHRDKQEKPKATAPKKTGPSYHTEEDAPESRQVPIDEIEEASMESFPASDPPAHGAGHS